MRAAQTGVWMQFVCGDDWRTFMYWPFGLNVFSEQPSRNLQKCLIAFQQPATNISTTSSLYITFNNIEMLYVPSTIWEQFYCMGDNGLCKPTSLFLYLPTLLFTFSRRDYWLNSSQPQLSTKYSKSIYCTWLTFIKRLGFVCLHMAVFPMELK